MILILHVATTYAILSQVTALMPREITSLVSLIYLISFHQLCPLEA